MTDIPEFNDPEDEAAQSQKDRGSVATQAMTPPQALAADQFGQENQTPETSGSFVPTPVPEAIKAPSSTPQAPAEKGFWRSYFDMKSGKTQAAEQAAQLNERVREFDASQAQSASERASALALVAQERANQHDNTIVNYMKQLTDVNNQIQTASEEATKFAPFAKMNPQLAVVKSQHLKTLIGQQQFLMNYLTNANQQRDVRLDAAEMLQAQHPPTTATQSKAGGEPATPQEPMQIQTPEQWSALLSDPTTGLHLPPGRPENGHVVYDVTSDEEEKYVQDQLAKVKQATGQDPPAIVHNTTKILDQAKKDFSDLWGKQNNALDKAAKYEALMITPPTTQRLQDMLQMASEAKDGDDVNDLSTIINASEDKRKGIIESMHKKWADRAAGIAPLVNTARKGVEMWNDTVLNPVTSRAPASVAPMTDEEFAQKYAKDHKWDTTKKLPPEQAKELAGALAARRAVNSGSGN
jgi:hypothetical protein